MVYFVRLHEEFDEFDSISVRNPMAVGRVGIFLEVEKIDSKHNDENEDMNKEETVLSNCVTFK